MKHLSVFERYNWFRLPDWRFNRVLKIVDRYPSPGRCTKRDDKFVKQAKNFVLRYRQKTKEDEREVLWLEEPGLFYAYELFIRQEDQPEGAAFLEARLLAGQNYEEIADCMGTIPETIIWYETLFFNICDKLKHRDWITAQVLIPAIMRHQGGWKNIAKNSDVVLPFKDSTVAKPYLDASLKLFAYFGGRHMVDIMITGFQIGKPLISQDADDVAAWFDKHISNTVRRRSAQAVMQFEINKYNITELLAIHTRIMEIERSEENKSQQRTVTERHIKAMVDDIPWLLGDKGEKILEGTLIGRLDKLPGELRDDEVLKVSSGEVIPGLYKDFPERLPNPRKKNSKLLEFKDTDLD